MVFASRKSASPLLYNTVFLLLEFDTYKVETIEYSGQILSANLSDD